MDLRNKMHDTAIALHQALKAVDECRIPVMSRDRSLPLKEQARLTRVLFKQLGLKGIRIRTPHHAHCSSVEVYVPYSDSFKTNLRGDDEAARRKIEEILARAFPNHDDRSDVQSDYFERKWFIWPLHCDNY